MPDGPTQLRALNLTDGSAHLHWKPPHNPVDKYNVQVASPGGEHGPASPKEDWFEAGSGAGVGGAGYSADGWELMPLPRPAPPLQASAPGSAVDYPLTDLAIDTNYTATVRGLRGPNFTSPASITFTTGTAGDACGSRRVKGTDVGLIPVSSHPSLPGLKPPRDLEAKEVTPRTALLTWTAPEVPPTGYLLSFDTPGGQIQVPYFAGHRRLPR